MTRASRQLESVEQGEDVRVLDGRGCLTLDGMCFIGQLSLYQQGAVERHLQTCSVCAQQVAALARASAAFQEHRPRVPVPAEIKILSRQVALRSPVLLAAGSSQAERRIREPRGRRARRPWYQSPVLLVSLLAGMVAATAVALIVLLLS
jgi:hypothetical protein